MICKNTYNLIPRLYVAIALLALQPICTSYASTPFKLPACPAESVKDGKNKPELAPILIEEQKQGSVPNPGTKDPAQQSKPADQSVKPNAVGKRKLNNFEKAKNVNLVPLALIPSESENEERKKLILERHKEQLKDLWNATIERSPDIQFAISVLQPNSNPKHATAAAMKLVGNALFNVGGTLAPNSATRTGMGLAPPLIARLFQQEKSAPSVSVGETLVLYKMVRDISDNMVDSYWNYRRVIAERDAVLSDLAELESQREEVVPDASPIDVAQFQYLVHKSEREANVCNEKVGIYELHLLDLCGTEAMDKLKVQMLEEKQAITQIVGKPYIGNPLAPPQPSSANAKP